MWQPVDHDGFEWEVEPTQPDLQYDVGAIQIIREYVGNALLTLAIEGADPAVDPPPATITQPNPHFFNTLNSLESIQEVDGNEPPAEPPIGAAPGPPNTLLHQWYWNAEGDAVTLETTFEVSAAILAASPTFGEDLGDHALREFQMMPYFLGRLYKRDWLGELD